MEPIKETPTTSSRRKLAQAIKKLIHHPTQSPTKKEGDDRKGIRQSRASMEAFLAKLFAGVSSVKAAYAEFQLAQSPYDAQAIKIADEGVVQELKTLSLLKQSFLKNEIDSSPPHVTLMLAEIQEQQSLLRTYEITARTLESQIRLQEAQIDLIKQQFNQIVLQNNHLENKLKAVGCSKAFKDVKLEDLNITQFVEVLNYALKSVRHFTKHLVRDMESANWNLDTSARSIHPGVEFAVPADRILSFESFVMMEMFEDFDSPFFAVDSSSKDFFRMFEKMKNENPRRLLGSDSPFARFARSKYMKLIHPTMELSLFRNLVQRDLVRSGNCPESLLFLNFVEMAKRIWLFHCLAHCFGKKPYIFQAKKGSRFSQVYMACINDDESFQVGVDELRVAFTVVPGFQISRTVIQCQVYLSRKTTPFLNGTVYTN